MKKIAVLILIILLCLPYMCFAKKIDNINEYYKKCAITLQSYKIISGDKEGNLMLDEKLKRQDMVIILARLLGEQDRAVKYPDSSDFKDLKKVDKIYVSYINWAIENKYIIGMDKENFGFNKYVNTRQLQSILLRVLGYVEESMDWNLVTDVAVTYGIMDGLKIDDFTEINRGEMSAMVLNTLNQSKKGSTLTLKRILNLK